MVRCRLGPCAWTELRARRWMGSASVVMFVSPLAAGQRLVRGPSGAVGHSDTCRALSAKTHAERSVPAGACSRLALDGENERQVFGVRRVRRDGCPDIPLRRDGQA